MRCDGCGLDGDDCVCPRLKVGSRLGVVVVMHPLEVGRRSNTGRLAPAVLVRAEKLVAGPALDPAVLARPNTALLWPGGAPAAPARLAAIDQVVALDGTWSQARRMRARIPAITALPSLALPARPRQRRLRRPRDPSESSTAEAIAIALELAGDLDAAVALRQACAGLIEVLTRPGRPRGDLIQ